MPEENPHAAETSSPAVGERGRNVQVHLHSTPSRARTHSHTLLTARSARMRSQRPQIVVRGRQGRAGRRPMCVQRPAAGQCVCVRARVYGSYAWCGGGA